MASPPPAQVPTISPAEIQILVSRAGLVLNPGQVADLVLAWRQVAGLIATLPRQRPLADDMALVFRLPPPGASAAASDAPEKPPKARAKPAPRLAPAGTRKEPAKGKAKAAATMAPSVATASAVESKGGRKAKAPSRPAKAKR